MSAASGPACTSISLQLESFEKRHAAAVQEKVHLEEELQALRAAAQHSGGSGAGAGAEDGEDGRADAQELISVFRQQLQEAHEAVAKVRQARQSGSFRKAGRCERSQGVPCLLMGTANMAPRAALPAG